MVYSIVLKERGDIEAEKRMTELEDLINQNEVPPFMISFFIGWKIYLFMENNQIDEANKIVSEFGLDLDKKKTHSNEAAYVSYVRLLLKQNKLKEAELLISELYALASAGKRLERMIELKISSAILYIMKDERDKASAYIIEAMELASTENLLSYFVYNIDQINELLNEVYKIIATSKTKITNKFINDLKSAIERREKFKKLDSEVDISARELDTLKLIAEELTNQEIADKLFISLNTVKTHLKNIFIKLDVDNRNKAVAKAKELDLI